MTRKYEDLYYCLMTFTCQQNQITVHVYDIMIHVCGETGTF